MINLNDVTKKFGLQLTEEQLDKFKKYYELLIEKNKVMNLTAITDWEDVVLKHFADSLLLCKYIDLNQPMNLIDVGTGAGFPGIPLKIVFPQLKITLMDSLNKRLLFLEEVIKELGLEDIETVHMRAEDGGKSPLYREKYDLVVSRAVANLSSLSEFCLPFVKIGGYFIPYKASGLEEEIKSGKKAIRILGGQVENIFTTKLPETDMERTFVMVKKIHETDEKYPRKSGIVTKNPLG